MRYSSTGTSTTTTDLKTAILNGLAPDGGLYMPASIPHLPESFWNNLRGKRIDEIGAAMAAPFVEELEQPELQALIADALDFPIPLRQIDEQVWLLELFHGPTLAFKDVGARFLARIMSRLLDAEDTSITILVATSGDTGGAVAQAFHGVPGTRVAVLFPKGKVSPAQESQFSTLGGNVRSLAVDGSFDDCQALVKQAFQDKELRARIRLTSANSISIGRLLPQSFYYAYALAQWELQTPPLFCTPSGNFGNLTAGLLAQAMGLPSAGFIAATNSNDAVPRYLVDGNYDPRTTIPTISNAMDVGDPSNFARVLALFDGDLERVRASFTGRAYDDEETKASITATHRDFGVVLDPHTAVGVMGLRDELHRRGGGAGIVLATAHPAKFREQVEPLIGQPILLPPQLARCVELPSQAKPLANNLPALTKALSDWD